MYLPFLSLLKGVKRDFKKISCTFFLKGHPVHLFTTNNNTKKPAKSRLLGPAAARNQHGDVVPVEQDLVQLRHPSTLAGALVFYNILHTKNILFSF